MSVALVATLAVALVLGIAAIAFTSRLHPSRLAARRVKEQLTECQRIIRENAPRPDPSVQEAEAERPRWFDTELRNISIEMLEVPGFGNATIDLLRRHGITTLFDVPAIQNRQIPNVGEKKRQALWTAGRKHWLRLQAASRTVAFDALDAHSGGRLSKLRREHEAQELVRAREREAAEIRAAELRRRLEIVRELQARPAT